MQEMLLPDQGEEKQFVLEELNNQITEALTTQADEASTSHLFSHLWGDHSINIRVSNSLE